MLEISVLSVAIINNDSIFRGGRRSKYSFLGKPDVGLNIYSNFSKIVIEGSSNVKWINDCLIINCDNSGKNMVRII